MNFTGTASFGQKHRPSQKHFMGASIDFGQGAASDRTAAVRSANE